MVFCGGTGVASLGLLLSSFSYFFCGLDFMKTPTKYGQNKNAADGSACNSLNLWLRGVDLNHRPLGYEPKASQLTAAESARVKE